MVCYVVVCIVVAVSIKIKKTNCCGAKIVSPGFSLSPKIIVVILFVAPNCHKLIVDMKMMKEALPTLTWLQIEEFYLQISTASIRLQGCLMRGPV